jgi:hypothetical protein
MATLGNVVCLVIHQNVIHRFIVQALQDAPLCSSTTVHNTHSTQQYTVQHKNKNLDCLRYTTTSVKRTTRQKKND